MGEAVRHVAREGRLLKSSHLAAVVPKGGSMFKVLGSRLKLTP